MALAKRLITGMRDITSAEMQVREYVINQTKETHKSFRFIQVETPYVERIKNLTNKQGEDNEKLISEILKRGDKLNLKGPKEENDLVDSGLRYDLIPPLSRYYANSAANLLSPFKALQMGNVWRADRPQEGRLRQFIQCDVDTLGDTTSLAEVELILVTTTAPGRICPGNGFTVRINDRGILHDMALHCGFAEESMDRVFITLNKMDRIGYEGVEKGLLEPSHGLESVSKYLDMLKNMTKNSTGVRALGQMFSEVMPADMSEGLAHVTDTVTKVAKADFGLESDPTLVRGMSYYTGTIFEVSMGGSGGSVVGGGRYDKMIGKSIGMGTLTCGLSIGSERIVTILMGNGFTVPGALDRKAFLFEKGVNSARLMAVVRKAVEEREKGVRVPVAQMNRNKRFQEEQLGRERYTELKEFYKESLEN